MGEEAEREQPSRSQLYSLFVVLDLRLDLSYHRLSANHNRGGAPAKASLVWVFGRAVPPTQAAKR